MKLITTDHGQKYLELGDCLEDIPIGQSLPTGEFTIDEIRALMESTEPRNLEIVFAAKPERDSPEAVYFRRHDRWYLLGDSSKSRNPRKEGGAYEIQGSVELFLLGFHMRDRVTFVLADESE